MSVWRQAISKPACSQKVNLTQGHIHATSYSFASNAFYRLAAPMMTGAVTAPLVEVYKTATCGCCEVWVKHLKANRFTVTVHNVSDIGAYRKNFGIPGELGSCHTGLAQGYALEGHVPATEIRRLLAEKPQAKGLAVPSMPLGSPGMEGQRQDPYDVLLVKADGSYSVYKHYSGK